MTVEAKTYKTAGAFRTALETRLHNRARAEGTDLQRLRRQVAFDRFLARMFLKGPNAPYPWVLKGGYAMELRTHAARTTKDIDLTLVPQGELTPQEYDLCKIGRSHLGNPGVVVGSEPHFLLQDLNLALHFRQLVV
jgi:Nucleotidyl transferase AbiEii toxin, Type IV TA system